MTAASVLVISSLAAAPPPLLGASLPPDPPPPPGASPPLDPPPLTGGTDSVEGAVMNEREYNNKFGDPLPGLTTILGVAALVNSATTWAGVARGFNPR